nr:hypothetical protein [Burkholderia cenocepacia]
MHRDARVGSSRFFLPAGGLDRHCNADGAMMVMIYEPLYEQGQVLSEPAFHELRLADNSHAAWREFRILVDFWRRGDHRRKGKVGIFSPKFGLKTRVDASRFLTFVDRHGDVDVCLINPFPQIPYYSYNVWMQGEINHPGLTARSQALVDAVGLKWDLHAVPRHGHQVLCYSNFWVGTERFWDAYVGGVLDPLATFLERNSDDEAARAVMGDTWHSDAAPFLPFIVERLFSTFLSLCPELKVAAYQFDDVLPYCLTDYERELVDGMRPIVDAADASGQFPRDLIAMQDLACRLYVRYAREHFAANQHPHTGRTVSSA